MTVLADGRLPWARMICSTRMSFAAASGAARAHALHGPLCQPGFAALDRYLPGGGWPLGPLIEVFVERYGVGELSLLMPALAALT